jgi:hypothetical protein
MSELQGSIKAGTWTEEDKKQVIEFVNFVAKNAKFDGMTVATNIELFKMLNWIQTGLIKKIDSCVLDVVAIHEPEPKAKSKGKK